VLLKLIMLGQIPRGIMEIIDLIKLLSDITDVPIMVATLIWTLKHIEELDRRTNELLGKCLDKLE